MIVFLTNIPTPYRTAFFNRASQEARAAGTDLVVLYCAQTETGRHWPFAPQDMRHRFEVLPGVSPRLGGVTFHINPSVRRRLRALKPSLIICAGAWNMPTVVLAARRQARIAPTLFWSEGHDDAELFVTGPVPWLRRRVLRRFDGFVTPNARSDDWVRRQVGDSAPILRLPNLVDEGVFRVTDKPRSAARAETRAELDLSAETRLLVQVGRLEPRKGVLELADAFLRHPDRTSARLVFVGSGSLQAVLAQRAAQSQGGILLAGEADMDRVRRYLWAADAFVLNTLRDPNPLSPLEAAFAGLPVLLSARAGNVDEIVEDGVTGKVIADPTAPDAALDWALRATSEGLEQAGQAGLARVEKRFSLAPVTRRFMADAMALMVAHGE